MQQAPHFSKVLLQPTRLAVVTHLVACGGEASFAEVRAAAGAPSHSLLWTHTEVLAEAGYIEVRKHIDGRQVSHDPHPDQARPSRLCRAGRIGRAAPAPEAVRRTI